MLFLPIRLGDNHRRDIDGLRAIAVISVIVFHINESWLPGGFVGVDIFFVISGYLISQHLFMSAKKQQPINKFLIEFYIKRIQRLAPALFLVILTTLFAAQIIMLPQHLLELSNSAIASVFSSANIFFTYWIDNGYFAESNATRPLLHLWSLGVEEQFYFIWPFIILISARIRPGTVITAAFALIIISTALSEWLSHRYPVFAYYMLPARVFELLLGAIIAGLNHKKYYAPKNIMHILTLIGLLLIAYSLLFINSYKIFPGYNAIPATLGTSLIIYSGMSGNKFSSNIIGNPISVWIGLISYSLYLWHWPIIALLKYSYIEITPIISTFLVPGMIILAWASCRFVELPFRNPNQKAFKAFRNLFLIPASITTAASAFIIGTGGFGVTLLSPTYSLTLAELDAQTTGAFSFKEVCQRPLIKELDLHDPRCVINSSGEEPRTLLWGDSHASHHVGTLSVLADRYDFSFRNIEHSSCPPFRHQAHEYAIGKYKETCRASVPIVVAALQQYETIIISAAWSSYNRRGTNFESTLVDTLSYLSQVAKYVIVIGDPPSFKGFDNLCAQKAEKLPLDCDNLFSSAQRKIASNEIVRLASERFENVSYIDFNDVICPNGLCSPIIDNNTLYYDETHLSMQGSRFIGRAIMNREDVESIFSKIKR